MNRFHADNWTGSAEDVEAAQQFARDVVIEDDRIEDPEHALDVIMDGLDHADEWHPDAQSIVAAGLRDRLARIADPAEQAD